MILGKYTFKERLEIREYYKKHPLLSRKSRYAFDWKMSHLEYIAWGVIRCNSHIANYFYPEYPIDKFFCDFGSPIHKIVFECDSQLYHKNTKREDAERQHIIENDGWMVFRFNARQIFANKYEEIIAECFEESGLEQKMIDNDADNCFECFTYSTKFINLINTRS